KTSDGEGAPVDHVQLCAVSISDLVNGVPKDQLHAYQTDLQGYRGVRPTVMHDAAAGDPMWLVTDGNDNSHIDVVKMTRLLSSSPTFRDFLLAITPHLAPVDPLNPDGTEAPRSGAGIEKAAEANHLLVAAQTVGVTSTQDAAQWYEIDVGSGTPVLAQQGRV